MTVISLDEIWYIYRYGTLCYFMDTVLTMGSQLCVFKEVYKKPSRAYRVFQEHEAATWT